MNRIFVTGDCHGSIEKLEKFAKKHRGLDKSDVMIVAGDWGVVWDKSETAEEQKLLQRINSLPFTLFIVLGSHENYSRIEKLPVATMFGSPVWQDLRYPNIFYAHSGHIYNINGKKIFCFNGGLSADKDYREEGFTWWPQELSDMEQMQSGADTLAKVNNMVDYIVTHDCPLSGFMYLPQRIKDKTEEYISHLNYYFEQILKTTVFKKWYCGKYHYDGGDMKITFLFDNIKEITE